MSDVASRLESGLADRYAIERKLGEGGMATVFLARDLKHNRHVALKVLKPELAAVVGAERFLAEIETTANLQHPNILPLYDSGEADTFLYYVMPYVEGQTLRDRLDVEKQLPVDEAVKIATAVAHALAFAHHQGVVHRDIKPANILFQGGQPVVGDFGIALAVGAGGAARLTETGLSVGTPFYMSPEQATGDQQVGARSDIYSLGCVLYEMLVGDPPYTGSTAQAVLGQIISGKPVTVTEKRAAVPAHVDGVIRKALEKMPADRFATASDFASAVADPAFRYGEAGVAGAPSKGSRRLVAGLTATVLVLAVSLAWTLTHRDGAEPQTATWMDFAPTEPFVQRPGGAAVGFALTADGRHVVYQGEDEDGEPVLWRRALSSLDPVLIEGTEGGYAPAVSADGRTLAFVVPPNVKTVPLEGGPAVTVAEGEDPTWDDDGSLYFVRDKALYRRPPEGGNPEAWTTPAEAALLTPWALPDGRGLLVTIRPSVQRFSRIAVVGPDGGEVREILDGTGARYMPPGRMVYTTADGTLWAAPFDLATLEVGQPVALWGGVSVHGSSYTRFALSASGSLLYQRPAPSRPRETVWVDRDGSFEPLGGDWSHSLGAPVLAPDGSAVVFEWRGDVWVRRFDGTPPLQLTFDGSGGRRPSWTPGSDSIMYRERSEGGEEGLHTRRADGSGQSVLTHTDAREVITARWTPDREWLVYRTNTNLSGSADIMAIRVGRDSVPTPVVASPAADLAPAISRDGRWMAYHSDESGRTEVYVVPFPEGEVGGKWKISAEGGITPIWSHDGRELFYASDEGFVAVPVQTEPSFASGAPRILFPLDDFATFVLFPEYDVAPDGRFLMKHYLAEAREGPLVLVQNLAAELAARIPQ